MSQFRAVVVYVWLYPLVYSFIILFLTPFFGYVCIYQVNFHLSLLWIPCVSTLFTFSQPFSWLLGLYRSLSLTGWSYLTAPTCFRLKTC